MGAIPEADPDEPMETKPFKFVTGEFLLPNPILLSLRSNKTQLLTSL